MEGAWETNWQKLRAPHFLGLQGNQTSSPQVENGGCFFFFFFHLTAQASVSVFIFVNSFSCAPNETANLPVIKCVCSLSKHISLFSSGQLYVHSQPPRKCVRLCCRSNREMLWCLSGSVDWRNVLVLGLNLKLHVSVFSLWHLHL